MPFSPLQAAVHCRAAAAAASCPWRSGDALLCLQGVNVPDDLAGQSARPSTAPGCMNAPASRQRQTATTAVQTETPRPRQHPARRARSLQVRAAALLRGAVQRGMSTAAAVASGQKPDSGGTHCTQLAPVVLEDAFKARYCSSRKPHNAQSLSAVTDKDRTHLLHTASSAQSRATQGQSKDHSCIALGHDGSPFRQSKFQQWQSHLRCRLPALRCGRALWLAPEGCMSAAKATGAGLISARGCPADCAQTVFLHES